MSIKIRQMCGGGTWSPSDLRPRRTDGAVIFDAIGFAVAWSGDWGKFTLHTNHLWRDRLFDRFGNPRCWWPRGHALASDPYCEDFFCARCRELL